MAEPERRHAMLGTVALEWSLRHLVAPGGAAAEPDGRGEGAKGAADGHAGGARRGAGPVFIVGFDMTMHPERQYRHYGGHPAGAQTSRASLRKFHEPRADSRYVRSLVARGLVRELVPDVLGNKGKVNLRWNNNMTRRRIVHHFVMNMSRAMLRAQHI